MNIQTIKNVYLALIFMSALVLIGVGGSVSPAFAFGESVLIDGGTPVTNYQQVTLTLVPGAATKMSISNDTVSWTDFPTITSPMPWTLSPAAGDKTVYVQFKNSQNIVLANVNASIKLDYIIDTSFNIMMTPGYSNFGNLGKTATGGKAVAVDSTSRIVSVGTFDNGNGNTVAQIIRYKTDGTFDDTFGAGTGLDAGKVYFGPNTGAHKANAVAINPDNGKIVVVGTYDRGNAETAVWVMQLLDNGTLDPDFAGGGYFVIGGQGADQGNAVAIQPDGNIIVVGTYDNRSTNKTSVWVLRITAAGDLDPTFSQGAGNSKFGSQFVPGVGQVNVGFHSGNGVALDNGKIVVTGSFDWGTGQSSIWVLRLLNNGTLDLPFGSRGTGYDMFSQNGPLTAGNAVAIKAFDGTIYIAGTYDWTGGNTDTILLKLDSNGLPVTAFGSINGAVSFGGGGADSGSALAIQGDGKIVVAGTVDNGGTTSLMVNRFNVDGSEDTSLNNGASNYSFGTGGSFQGKSVALQSDGKIVVVGKGDNLAGTSSILTLRLQSQFSTSLLTVNTVGTGSVTVFPGTLTLAGSTYTGNFAADPFVPITLTAVPAAGASFTNWTGDAACNGSASTTCVVTMEVAHTVTANFTQLYSLSASVIAGVGTITSVPTGTISCNSLSGVGCSSTFLSGTSVTLTTAPRPWYTLSGFWSGGSCSGSITVDCTVAMDQARTVNATFIPNLSVRVVGFGDYPTMTEAYGVANASAPTAIIQAKNIVFPSMTFNLPVNVTLQGGKGTDFTAAAVGYTFVTAPLKISSGRLNASNLRVNP